MEKWTKNIDDSMLAAAIEEWAQGLAGVSANELKEAIDYCRVNLEWPPSIAEFRKICEKVSGIPDEAAAFRMAVARKFDHPIARLAFVQMSTWDFTHDAHNVLYEKFKIAYKQALQDYRDDPVHWDKWLVSENKRLIEERTQLIDQLPQQERSKLIGEYHIDEIREKLGQKSKYLSEEEKNNVRSILEKAKSMPNPDEGKSHAEIYDEIRKQRQAEGMEHYKRMQATINKDDGKQHYSKTTYKNWGSD